MTTDRIKEIQGKTAYPESVSVKQALLQVWNECEQEKLRIANVSNRRELLIKFCDALFEQNGTQITNVQIDFLMKKFNL